MYRYLHIHIAYLHICKWTELRHDKLNWNVWNERMFYGTCGNENTGKERNESWTCADRVYYSLAGSGTRVLLAAPYRVTRSQRVRFLPRMSVTSSGFAGNCGECKARKKKRQIKHDPDHLAAKGEEAGENREELEGRMENEGWSRETKGTRARAYRSNYRVVRYGFMQIRQKCRGSFGINGGWTNVSRFFCWIIVPPGAT